MARRFNAAAIAVAAITIAGSLGMHPMPSSAAPPSYSIMLNWFPEPEEGGFYEAQRLGLYQKAGVTATIAPFRRVVTVEQYVLSGAVTFGMGNADEILQYNQRGAKLVAVMTSFQKNPLGILWHAEDTSIHGVADLSNHTLIYSFGVPFEKYLVGRYHYKNFTTKANDFTSRSFAADPTAVHQCFVTSEPYLYTKQGLKVKYAFVADSGYNPYASMLYTTQAFAKSHPDVVRAVVTASVQGWASYLKSASATNTYMRSAPGAKDYPETADEQDFSFRQMQRYGLVDGGDAATHGIGWFSASRWKTLQQQMDSVGLDVHAVNLAATYTDSYLPTKS